MVLSPRRRRDAAPVADAEVAPIQFRLEAREEQVTTDDGRRLSARCYLICDPAANELDPPVIEVRDAAGLATVGELSPEVADAVAFQGTDTYRAAFCLWEWRTESGQRFALRLLLAPGWTVEQIAEEPAVPS